MGKKKKQENIYVVNRKKKEAAFARKDNRYSNTPLAKFFPVIITIVILIASGVVFYLFNTYKNVVEITQTGYFLSSKYDMEDLKKNTLEFESKLTPEVVETVEMENGDNVYKTPLNHYFDNTKTSEIDMEYPLFANDGLAIINYNEEVNMITTDFIRYEGYEGLILSYGKAYDSFRYTQIDDLNYLVLSYSNGLFINLYDVIIDSGNTEYTIPINSIIYFDKDSINIYSRQEDGTFKKEALTGINLTDEITFYYDGGNEKYSYGYEEFLEGVGTLYIAKEVEKVEEKEVVVEKPTLPERKKVEESHIVEEETWEEPTVSVSNIKVKTYSFTGDIKISDPAHVIVKEPTFTFELDNKIVLRRSYSGTRNFAIAGLMSETTYKITGTYTYLDEDMETKRIVKFYEDTITTKSLNDLDNIELAYDFGDVYAKKIAVKNVHIISDLESETLNGLNKAALEVGTNTFSLSYSQVVALLSGTSIDVESSATLKSNKEHEFTIRFYDKSGNELNTIGNTGVIRTSKVEPTVTLSLLDRQIDYVQVGINLINEDNVSINNYKYQVINTSGTIVSTGDITGNKIKLNDLDPNGIYTFKVLGDIDTADGSGVKEEYQIGSMDFSTLALSSLGFMNLNIEKEESVTDSVNFKLNINSTKTNSVLTRIAKNINLVLSDENGTKVGEINLDENDERLSKLKNGEVVDIEFNGLASNSKYILTTSSTAKQGKEEYTNDCIINESEFETRKNKAVANITNMLVSETMVDFDVYIMDTDGAVLSSIAKVELRDSYNNLVSSNRVDINGDEPTRITYNNLTKFTYYYLYIYVDEYNETSSSDTYKTNYYLTDSSGIEIYTEEGISGQMELISSKRTAQSKNIADVNSNLKWIESTNYYNLHHTVDEQDHLHIYSRTSSSSYVYDLSEYWGRTVKVSFKIKAITPTASGAVYLNNYLSGTTSSYYGIKLEPPTSGWQSVAYNFVVGSYNYSNNQTLYYSHQTTSYGKSYTAGVGFYISGGTGTTSEYEISEFMIELYPEEEIYNSSNDVTNGDKPFEKGIYNNKGVAINSTYYDGIYVRYTKEIEITESGYYRFDYGNYLTQEFTGYFQIVNKDGTNYKTYNDYRSGVNIYIPKDKKVYMYFLRARGYETPNLNEETGEVENLYLTVKKVKNANMSPQFEPKSDTNLKIFDYKLETEVKISIKIAETLKKFSSGEYYIRAYHDETYEDYVYDDLKEQNSVEDIKKSIPLAENTAYTLELGIKVDNRYYALDSFDLNTEGEVGSVSTINEFRWIQPYGNYVVLNDLDFTDYTFYIGYEYNPINGTIDFQGYKATIQTKTYDYMRKIYFMGESGTIKNLVLDIHLTHETGLNEYGFVMYNYGTTDGLYMNIYDDRESVTKDPMLAMYSYSMYKDGVIKNFVINLTEDIQVYDDTSFLVYYNRGTIKSGYVYGGDMVVSTELKSGDSYRRVTMLEAYGYSQSLVKNVYSLSSIRYETDFAYDKGGILVYDTYGKLQNAYVVGDTNPNKNSMGPAIAYLNNSAEASNVYYMSDNYYSATYQSRIYPVALNNPAFQNSVLSEGFNVDEMLELGYYPQVIFSCARMPQQPYIELPKSLDEEIDIVSWEVTEKTTNTATVKMIINNPYGEDIVGITVADIESEIVSQTFEDGNTTLILKLKNPTVFKSKYVIRNIKSKYGDFTTTKLFTEGEKYILVDLYKEINSIDDWKQIDKSRSENYILMKDLNFYGENKYLIGYFYGKLDGNNHTIKNIEINSSYYGLFNYMYGTIKNLKVDTVKKTVKGSNYYEGLIGHCPKGAVIENVHVKNVTFEIPNGVTGTIFVGGLVGYANNTRINHSSVTNIKITSEAEVSNVYMGGLVGRFYSGNLYDSYAADVDINVTNAYNASGIGGLVGSQDAGSDGDIANCYSTGDISSNTSNVGGLIGTLYGYLDSSYSSVNIKSDLGQIGGIVGYLNSASYVTNCLYTGNIFSNSSGLPIGRIAGNVNASGNNYAYTDTLVNGTKNTVTYGEPTLTKEQLMDETTYTNIIKMTDHFDYSRIGEAIHPHLFNDDLTTLQLYQTDEPFFIDRFEMETTELNKRPTDATIVIKVHNPEVYEITGVEIDQMNVTLNKVTNQVNPEDGINYSYLELVVTPERYFDNYVLTKVLYKDENQVAQEFEKSFVITMSFYHYINNEDDFANIDSTYSENYYLTRDLDFTNYDMSKMKLNKAINSLVTTNKEVNYTIKGINLTFTNRSNYQSLIKSIGAEMSNINWEDITLTNETAGEDTYFNLININYGTIQKCNFKNITLNAPNKDYVAIIGKNEGFNINNVTIDTTDIDGKHYVASFIATQNNANNRVIQYIDATDLNVYGSGNYVGGIFGYTFNVINSKNVSPEVYPTAYITLTSSVKSAEDSKTIIYGKGSYVGGVSGIGDCEYCTIDHINVKGESSYTGGVAGQSQAYYHYHTKITDSVVRGVNYTGGYAGYGRYIRYAYLNNMHVIGTSTSGKGVGGLVGNSGYSFYYNVIENSTIENNGIYTGGIIGYSSSAGIYYETVQNNVNITGTDYVGGLSGFQTQTTLGYNTVYDTNITARGNYAGGITGFVSNQDVSSGTSYDNIIADVNISANAYAGGFWGGIVNDFNNTNYALYFDGNITVSDETKAGFAVGDANNISGYQGRGIGIYEGSTINGKTAKSYMVDAPEGNILDVEANEWNNTNTPAKITITDFKEGYYEASTGNVSLNYSYYYAAYTEKYKFEKGKIYNFNVNFPNKTTSGAIYQIFFYNEEGKYIGSSTSSTAYFDPTFSTTYTRSGRFKALKDGYFVLWLYDSRYVESIDVTRTDSNNYGMTSNQIISADIIRNRLTWQSYVSDAKTTQYDAITLGFHNTVFDYSMLASEETGLTIKDESGNNHNGVGNVSSVSTEGMYFDYSDDNIKTENVKLNSKFSLTFTFRHTNTSTGFLFSYGSSTKEKVALYSGTYRMYLRVNGSQRSLDYDIPVRDNATITVTYDGEYIKTYVDGILVTTVTYKSTVSGSDTDIFYIGRSIDNSYKYMGLISDVQIFNRVLTEEEVAYNYNNNDIMDESDLLVHYDLTSYKHTKTGYYPQLAENNTANYQMDPKVFTRISPELPAYYETGEETVAPTTVSSVLMSEDTTKAVSTIANKYHVYASGANSVNIEFDDIYDDLYFEYLNDEGNYEVVNVNKRVYTLFYDYKEDLSLIFGTGIERIEETYLKENLAKSMYIEGDNYYYINNGNLYKNNELILEDVLNLYNNYVLTNRNTIYDISTSKESKVNITKTLASRELPLYEGTFDNTTVKTYYNFSTISDGQDVILREGQFIVKDNNLYVYESDNLNNNLVFNTYNSKIYEFAVGTDHTLKVYGENLKSKDYLTNEFISEIYGSMDSNEPIMMIRYESGNIKVLNYESGEMLYELGNVEDVTLFSYIKDALTTTKVKNIDKNSYNVSNKLINKIVNTNNDEVLTELEADAITEKTKEGTRGVNNNVSNYVMSYDSSTGEYNVYNVEEIISTDVETVETADEKITANQFLYSYYYGKNKDNSIDNNKLYIYLGILAVVVINLILVRERLFKKDEKKD